MFRLTSSTPSMKASSIPGTGLRMVFSMMGSTWLLRQKKTKTKDEDIRKRNVPLESEKHYEIKQS